MEQSEEVVKADFPINKLLSDTDKQKLHEWLRHPGFTVALHLVDNVQVDWADQIMGRDYTKATEDRQIINDLLHKKGMRDGLVRFFRALQVWKKAIDNERAKASLPEKSI